MDIANGRYITYKPLIDGTQENDRHRVKVVSTNVSDITCEDVFGNQFRLSYSRVESIDNDSTTFDNLRASFA